ncbi:MAG: ATP-binding cassette domain-containing protein [Bdellovibrio sp.]
MSLIRLEKVTVSYGSQGVLREINLQVEVGECLVIMGPSGQGKSTLLKTLSGLITPENGKVFVEQNDWLMLSNTERSCELKKRGFLFQKNALFDSLTCLENICFPLRETTLLPDTEVLRRGEDFLKAVDILSARDLYPDEISGGMQKRLGIARALALGPQVVFYDDPTAGLDPITAKKIVELILKLKAENKATVIAVTNDIHRAYQMADRIGILIAGELVALGPPEHIKNHSDLRVQQFIHGHINGPLTEVES